MKKSKSGLYLINTFVTLNFNLIILLKKLGFFNFKNRAQQK